MKYKVGDIVRTTYAWSTKSTGEMEVVGTSTSGYYHVKVLKAIPYKDESIYAGAWLRSGEKTRLHLEDSSFVELNMPAQVVERDVIGELDEEQKRLLADIAIKTATDLGYCSETENVLRAMGLSNKQRHKVVIEFEIEVPYGTEVTDDMLRNICPENTNYTSDVFILEDENEVPIYTTKLVDKDA